MRLVYSSVPDFGDEDQRAWIYQYRNGGGADATAPWHSYYCFTENEFVLADFEVMNYCTSTHPQSFQRMQMLVVKFLIAAEAEGGGGICGKRMLVDGVVKENLGGRTKVVRECRSEEERVAALREYFGITLTEEQIEGIRGYVTELRGAALENTG
jgi:arylamine N-acetyltransferase